MLCPEKMVYLSPSTGGCHHLPPHVWVDWWQSSLQADKTHSALSSESLRGKKHHHLLETVGAFLPDLISFRNGALRLPSHLDFLQGDH